VKHRVFMFQLLAVMGQWDRALTQLNVAGDLDDSTLAMVQTYREALLCEGLRADVFSGKRSPVVFGKPEQWIALLLESLTLMADGQYARSQEVRNQAFDLAPATSGTIGDPSSPDSEDFEKMTEQIDKYWEKLFADPITVTSSAGEVTIQPQRTNNILERFFRDLKRGTRRRSGTVSLNKTLRFMLTDTPIVKNLINPEYLEIILDGCRTLEERFERIDSRLVIEKLKAEQRKQQIISSEMKKIIKLPDLPERLSALLVN